jgi:Flp pilus assembly protein TadG
MKGKERGATIVEAAFTMTILFMFLIAILEFGRAYNEYQVLTNAAREAARYAVAPSPGGSGTLPQNTAVQQVATDWLNSAGITPASAPEVVKDVPCGSVSINGNTTTQQCTTVKVTAAFVFDAPLLLFGKTLPACCITSTAKMLQETNTPRSP